MENSIAAVNPIPGLIAAFFYVTAAFIWVHVITSVIMNIRGKRPELSFKGDGLVILGRLIIFLTFAFGYLIAAKITTALVSYRDHSWVAMLIATFGAYTTIWVFFVLRKNEPKASALKALKNVLWIILYVTVGWVLLIAIVGSLFKLFHVPIAHLIIIAVASLIWFLPQILLQHFFDKGSDKKVPLMFNAVSFAFLSTPIIVEFIYEFFDL